jgi:hypothetical protein
MGSLHAEMCDWKSVLEASSKCSASVGELVRQLGYRNPYAEAE